jgi:hypothetical protein
MIALRTLSGDCALTVAAEFAAALSSSSKTWQALLLLLRCVAMEPQPCDAKRAHMTKVLEILRQVCV